MKLETENRNGSTIIYVHEKRLDAHNCEILREQVLDIVDNGNVDLVIELSDVKFVDSSGLGVLLAASKSTSNNSGHLTLTGLQSQVLSMFELTRLHRVFDIKQSIQEAFVES